MGPARGRILLVRDPMMPLLLLLLACHAAAPEPPPPEPVAPKSPPIAAPEWPQPGAPFDHPVIESPPGFEKQSVFVIAGHGNGSKTGNLGAWCTWESDFALETADQLSDLLDATGHFDVVRARSGKQRPSYGSRIRHLERSGATAMIELHSDARANHMMPNGAAANGEVCWRDDGEPGFTILVNDRTNAPDKADRLALARAIAESMTAAGFLPWVGDNYGELYERDEVDGVWRDRRGLYMLRHPLVPAVIIETHNAKDGLETRRWEEPGTHDAFGRAMLAALFRWYDER